MRQRCKKTVFLLNIYTKVPHKILANQIKQQAKRIVHDDPMGIIFGIQGCSTSVNQPINQSDAPY